MSSNPKDCCWQKASHRDNIIECIGGSVSAPDAHRARAGHAPGIFFDPCPTGDLLGAALSATIWTSSSPRTPYFVILWAFLLFDNGYFDASFTFGIWYIWILTQFHQFSSIFCSFPPHPLLTRLISPHHGDPKKAGVM